MPRTKTHYLIDSCLISGILAAVFVVTGCSMSKPPSLEEAGTPPQTSMEAEVPHEEPSGQYTLKVSSDEPLKANESGLLKITIKDAKNGSPPSVKESVSNLILVSKDGQDFFRLPVKQTTPGSLTSQVKLPHEGPYQVCLQFTRADDKNFSAVCPLQIGEAKGDKSEFKTDVGKPKVVDGYEFTLNDYPETAGAGVAMPTFHITKEVRPVSSIEPINAKPGDKPGYAVLVSENGDRFYRTIALGQPAANKLFQQPVMFHVIVPEKGNYRLWAQFKIDGSLHTVEYSLPVN